MLTFLAATFCRYDKATLRRQRILFAQTITAFSLVAVQLILENRR